MAPQPLKRSRGTRALAAKQNERKQVHKKTQATDELYRLLSENASDLIYRYRILPSPKYEFISASAARITGYSPEEFYKDPELGSRILHPDDIGIFLKALTENTPPPNPLVVRWVKKDGGVLWMEQYALYTLDEQGRLASVDCIAHNITARKDAEQMQFESEERYRSTLNNMMEGCQIIDYDWRYVYVNDAAAKQGHKQPEELLMRTMMECYPGIEKTELFRALQECMDSRAPRRIENKFEFGDGTYGWFELSIQPIAEGLFILSIDITERKHIEQALQRNEIKYRTLHESMIDGFVQVTMDGAFIECNAIYSQMLGYSERELSRLTYQDITPEKWHAYEAEIVEKQIMKRGYSDIYEKEYRRKDGTIFPVELHTVLMLNEHGQPASMWAIARDITARKQSEIKIQKQIMRLNSLHIVDIALSSGIDLRNILDVVLEQVIVQLNVDACAIMSFNPQLQTLSHAANIGFRSNIIQQTKLKWGEGYAGRAIAERKTVHVSGLMEEKSMLAEEFHLSGDSFIEYFGTPLIVKGEIKGVLEVFHRSALNVDKDWLDFLETLAGQAAIAMYNNQLVSSLQRSNMDLSLAYDATIEGWSRAMDLRDKETEGHTLRVTDMTLKLAHIMGISQAEQVHIRRGALLHDVGKLGVPDQILFKPEKLSVEEWEIMKKHPTYAFEMILPIAYLRPALDIPYCHHEKWDGTGYPRGLRGEQIPLAARLFAIVDVWDALRTNRPYRQGWSAEKTREHICNQSGIHFDPRVVKAFLQMLDEEKELQQ